MTLESWQPIRVDALRVGHFVRLGHRWFEHPFLLNRFRIASDHDIAIIREAGLSNLSVDLARSDLAQTASALPPLVDPTPRPDSITLSEQLQARKAAQSAHVHRLHEELREAQSSYRAAVADCGAALALVGQGSRDAASTTSALVRTLLENAAHPQSPLTFVAMAMPTQSAERLACQSLDAAAIAAAVGRRLGVSAEDLNALTMSALLHNAGIAQLPESMHDETRITDRSDLLEFQHYPLLGVERLRECGGFPLDVLQIVRQHRERLDGIGFPEHAPAPEIHSLALVVGAIREFQVSATRADTALPAAALARLYRELRGAYGPVAVDNVVAALTVYPPGSFLALTDGSIGRVMRVNDAARLRPTVCLFDDALSPDEAQIVDLSATTEIAVAGVLPPRRLTREVREFFGEGWGGFALPKNLAMPA